MRFLILSDIHANQQALEAAFADAAGSFDQIVCLGDIVGYGGDPNAVTEWVSANVKTTVRGNHDRACTGDDCVTDFTPPARASAKWTSSVLTSKNMQFLKGLPQGPIQVEDFFLVHGSPRDEDEYVLTKEDATAQYRYLPGDVCFFGHTHVQVGFGLRTGRAWLLIPPRFNQTERVYELEPDVSYLINPGSVGQPRDHDPRAAYAIYDTTAKTVAIRRVSYDIGAAQKRILAAGLPSFLADRLFLGR